VRFAERPVEKFVGNRGGERDEPWISFAVESFHFIKKDAESLWRRPAGQ
jgi:hypothetical protein